MFPARPPDAVRLVNPEGGRSFVRTGVVDGSEYVTKGARYARTFTIRSGYRYLVDGVNTGELQCFVIPSSQLAAFNAGQSFTHYTEYAQTGGNCPGLLELKLPAGSYALAFRNPSGSTNAALTFTIEKWRIN